MTHILILTIGSRGDVQPYIALGKGLQRAGYEVTLCTHQYFEADIQKHGLGFQAMSNTLLELLLDSGEGRVAIENMNSFFGVIRTMFSMLKKAGPMIRRLLDDSWQGAANSQPDLVLFHPKAVGAVSCAEKLGVPVMMATPIVQYVPTRYFPSVGFPRWQLGNKLTAWYNRASYGVVKMASRLIGRKQVRQWRQSLGLTPPHRVDHLHRKNGEPIPVIHCISEHVLPRPDDWPDWSVNCGYWFLDRLTDWKPSQQLEDFLDAGEAPVYAGFGSMAGRKPKVLAQAVIQALTLAKKRGIIAKGWGGLEADDLPDHVLMVDEVPHDWLFPKMAAVIHHGGAGTTAAGLKAGCPTIVCPFFGDQPFWGWRINELGVGPPPIPQKKVTADKLAKAILEVTNDSSYKHNAQQLAEKINQEDGVLQAITIIDSYIE